MEPPSPARLYAAAGGVLLLAIGVVGFFYGASFGTPGTVERALGVLDVNAWFNVLYVAAGSLALLAATAAARAFALLAGLLFTLIGVWGVVLGGGEAILDLIPTGTGNSLVALAIGLLGLAAAAGTPRDSETRAEVAGQGP
ncbi:MAG: DUF4383 domain-containing protein [Solirubrobacterales bacterium]